MPRPADNYTHSQFEAIDSEFQGETVRCLHCKQWTGSVKTLSRKKEHLLKCPAYLAWRQAGHGQDIPPPNKYSKRDSSTMMEVDPYSSPYVDFTPSVARNRSVDHNKFFDEFFDDSTGQKCSRTRCKYCGFVRAKNTTRQFEHLQQCPDFLRSTDGQQAVADGIFIVQPDGQPNTSNSAQGDIFRGSAPNPNLTFRQHTPKARMSAGRSNATPSRPNAPVKAAPSLINHLLTKNRTVLERSTQLHFLSHAGCGTLSKPALQQWLTQQGHMSRALCTFIGGLIGKIRLSDTQNPNTDTSWRALDLLVSALNNAKRELDFLRSTHIKYGLQSGANQPKPAAKGFTDLFAAASSPAASLLEGLVVLWAVEHLYCISWQYAGNFIQAAPPSSTSYTIPSYLQPGQYDLSNPYGAPPGAPPHAPAAETAHVSALHEALIPNWTSLGFTKFVDACKSIVDELANAQTTGNGALELTNCEANFKQALWLWKLMFPEVTGMGEEAEEGEATAPVVDNEAQQTSGNSGSAPAANGHGDGKRGDRPIEIADGGADDDDDDDDDEDKEDGEVERDNDAPGSDSPYGGTGLGAVAAANRAA